MWSFVKAQIYLVIADHFVASLFVSNVWTLMECIGKSLNLDLSGSLNKNRNHLINIPPNYFHLV